MCKTSAVFRAFAVFVLILGWSITPAHAHKCERHNDQDHKHCDDPSEPPSAGLATVTLRYGMDYPADAPVSFRVEVGPDNPKKFGFANTNFNLDRGGVDHRGIIMQFGVDPDDCTAETAAADDPVIKGYLADQLNGAEIREGFFVVGVNRKNDPKTGKIIVEYWSDRGSMVRIQLSSVHSPVEPVVDVGDLVTNPDDGSTEQTFTFKDGHVVAWELVPGAGSDNIISCPITNPNVEIILRQR